MHNKTNRGVLIMEQTLQKRKAFHQPVQKICMLVLREYKLIGGKWVILHCIERLCFGQVVIGSFTVS